VRYLGGNAPYFEVVARGLRWVVPGEVALVDIMAWINRSHAYLDDEWEPGPF
jgi:hypothetical protein